MTLLLMSYSTMFVVLIAPPYRSTKTWCSPEHITVLLAGSIADAYKRACDYLGVPQDPVELESQCNTVKSHRDLKFTRVIDTGSKCSVYEFVIRHVEYT